MLRGDDHALLSRHPFVPLDLLARPGEYVSYFGDFPLVPNVRAAGDSGPVFAVIHRGPEGEWTHLYQVRARLSGFEVHVLGIACGADPAGVFRRWRQRRTSRSP